MIVTSGSDSNETRLRSYLSTEKKMRLALSLFAILACAGSSYAQAATSLSDAAGHYSLATGASSVAFSIDSVSGRGIAGRFTQFTGMINLSPSDISRSSVAITIIPASVHTGQDRVDTFLKSEAVFDVKNNPSIRFRSTSIHRTGEKTATITGLLTARGHTGPATFNAELSSLTGKSIGFHVMGKVFRSPYGMDVGTPIYSNVVNFDMSLIGRRN